MRKLCVEFAFQSENETKTLKIVRKLFNNIRHYAIFCESHKFAPPPLLPRRPARRVQCTREIILQTKMSLHS